MGVVVSDLLAREQECERQEELYTEYIHEGNGEWINLCTNQ